MEKRKPSLLWALAALIIPIGVILYGTVWVGVRPPVLPLLAALALAAIMCLPIGYSWAELQEGMFEALGRIQILLRSEERRVGKECRSRWSPYH